MTAAAHDENDVFGDRELRRKGEYEVTVNVHTDDAVGKLNLLLNNFNLQQ